MPFPIEQNHQLLEERFPISKESSKASQLSIDLHMDLLIAFQDLSSFDVSALKTHPLNEILHYLEATHRYYLKTALKKIRFALEELSRDKYDLGDLQSTLFQFFNFFETDLMEHMREEEKTLFPYVARLLDAKNGGVINISISDKIELIEFLTHHDSHAEDLLERLVVYLKTSIEKYPGSMSLSVLIHKLEFLMTDLKVHSMIEEQVFVPQAIQLEKEVLQA